MPADLPVTLKMRRGIDDSQESRDKFFEILDGGFAAGLAAVTVHGRTVEQRYVGPSRWEFLKELKQHVGSKIVFGSGDLFTPQACIDMMRQTGVDGVTVARGAIGNPWIFAQVRALAAGKPIPPPPDTVEQGEVIREHYQLAYEIYGDRCGSLMRKFGIKYAAMHPDPIVVRDAFVKIRCRADWESVLQQHYSERRPGNFPPAGIHRAQGYGHHPSKASQKPSPNRRRPPVAWALLPE